MRLREFVEHPPELVNKTTNVDGIQVSINTNSKNASVYATSHGRRLGYAEFDRDGDVLIPYDLAVSDEYRGQGIAAVMYDYVKSLGFKIKASPDQTDDGKYFWKKNRGSKRVWETELDEQIIAKGTDWVDFAPSQTGVRPEYWNMAQQIKQHFGVEELQQTIDFETQDPETAKGTKVEHFGVKK